MTTPTPSDLLALNTARFFHLAASMAGRCSSGEEKGQGSLIHAVHDSQGRDQGNRVDIHGKAACGAAPGRRSVGWTHRRLAEITCPKCLRKLASIDKTNDGKGRRNMLADLESGK